MNNESFVCCASCQKEYDIPRFLPCGESICGRCVTKNTLKIDFKCVFCHKYHPIPIDGFPINKHLEKLCRSIDTDLYRGPIYQEFKSSLTNIQNLLNDLNQSYANGKQQINSFCDEIMNRIDVMTETKIKELNENREALMKEINKYKEDCLQHFLSQSQMFDATRKSSVDFCEREKTSLKKLTFDDDNFRDKISRIKDVEWKLTGEKKKLKKLIFKNTQMIFEPKETIEMIGKITYKKLNKINKKYINYIDLTKYLTFEIFSGLPIGVELMENGSFIFDYMDRTETNWITEIHSFQEGKQFCKSMSETIDGQFSRSLIKPVQDKIIFYLDTNLVQLIKITDEYLNLICSKPCGYQIKSIVVSSNQILCLIDRRDSQIVIFDWSLNELMVVNKNSNFFYFPRDLNYLYANEQYYFFRESDHVNIVKKSDGSLVKNFAISEDFKILTVNLYNIIVRDMKENRILYLDFNGNLIEAEYLVNFPENSLKIFADKTENIFIVDCKHLRIYYRFK